jgi:hypothetical protein
MRSSAGRERGVPLAPLCLLLALACGPPPQLPSASPAELAHLADLCGRPVPAYVATGRARFVSRDGEVEGELELRVAPPERAWLQVRSRALFGMVGNTIEVSLPGDGYLLVHEQREERFERVPYDSSLAAAVLPRGGPDLLLALVTGTIPCDPLDRAAGPVRAGVRDGVARYELELAPAAGGGTLLLGMSGRERVDLDWRVAGERRLRVQWSRDVPVGEVRIPSRIVADAPAAGVRIEIELRHVEPHTGFGPEAFEVGGTGNPPPNRGVDHG